MSAQEPYLPPSAPLHETLPPAGSFFGGFVLGLLLFAAAATAWGAVFFWWQLFGNPSDDGSLADRAALFGLLLIPVPGAVQTVRGFRQRRMRSAMGALAALLLPVLALAVWIVLLLVF